MIGIHIVQIKLFIFVCFVFLAHDVMSLENITEASVREMILVMKNASKTRSVEPISGILSDDVKVIRHVNLRGEKQLVKKSKKEYLDMISKSWDTLDYYDHEISNIVIDIRDNKARVTSDSHECATLDGRSMTADSKQEVVIDMFGSTPLITIIESDITVRDVSYDCSSVDQKT